MVMWVPATVVAAMAVVGTAVSAQGQAPGAPSAAVAPVVTVPSSLLQPSLASLEQTLGVLRVEKWKTARDMREATQANVESIRRDVDGTLPGLLATADAAPGAVSGMLPVSRNLSALYDVVLRVTVVAESSAPVEQVTALEQAMKSLEGARRAFEDRLQSASLAEEAQVRDLRKTVNVQAAAVTPCPPVPAPKPAVSPAKRKKKPAVKPKTAPAANGNNP
jgi:hypothetical protein